MLIIVENNRIIEINVFWRSNREDEQNCLRNASESVIKLIPNFVLSFHSKEGFT